MFRCATQPPGSGRRARPAAALRPRQPQVSGRSPSRPIQTQLKLSFITHQATASLGPVPQPARAVAGLGPVAIPHPCPALPVYGRAPTRRVGTGLKAAGRAVEARGRVICPAFCVWLQSQRASGFPLVAPDGAVGTQCDGRGGGALSFLEQS